jgi:hypothetical protein
MMSPSISPVSRLDRTRRSPTGSPHCTLVSDIDPASHLDQNLIKPVRVGFNPTFLISTSEFGQINAATMKNAADENHLGHEFL